ncbi:deoxynucleoside kinase [Spiroplasma endosymbiont of 'Nebria riversi']|uniref:deoxynucleoside kinase n=1 Tax=Spiroplasma endosymbiont of 'Nebria riversi' TaxID=2792084 RepID=UPI001C05E279|nr:deoxynucleoside kinase [Spiroplasma endosymbiont of 'Nebria riversi']
MRIILSGVVGAGKSTISEKLSKRYADYLLMNEPVNENPYLDEYYRDPQQTAFKMQVYMLMARSQQLKLTKGKANVIFDRSVMEDVIFVEVLKDLQLINDIDYQVYCDFYHNVVLESIYLDNLITPDLIVFLRVSSSTAIQRIKVRGRTSELLVDENYWVLLNEKYEQWYEKYKTKFNFLVIESDDKSIDEITNIIISKLK